MSSALYVMAWREILARALDGFICQEDVSPEWLVNPATNRRLKLDLFYPELDFAVRLVGLTARGQPRQSDWEAMEDEQRNQTRAELCRQNGVELFLLDPEHPHPAEQLQALRSSLSRVSRLLAQGHRLDADKAAYMPRLAEARSRLDQISRRVKSPDDLAVYAELWRDREIAAVAAVRRRAAHSPQPMAGPVKRFQPGEAIQHSRFGAGTVTAVVDTDGDVQIAVLFDNGQERNFLASLVADKLSARQV